VKKRICAAAAALIVFFVIAPSRAATTKNGARLQALAEALELCLLSAVGPTTISFQRNVTVQPCRDTEQLLFDLQTSANRVRQFGCHGSGSLRALRTDLLLISIHGGTAELASRALDRIPHIRRACWHIDGSR